MSDAMPRVLVSGCFDLLHSGHVAFLQEAATLGAVYVCAGSDRTVRELKGRPPVNREDERRYLLSALSCVHEARVSSGSGVLDFMPELEAIGPDVFFVNADGDSEAKREAVEARGVRYVVADRVPHGDFVPRSTTSLRKQETVPYRLDLAGGWLDQPYVSELHPGAVVTISLEPTQAYERRGGMSTSTRETARQLWGPRLPADDREKLAKMIFAFENPPGKTEVAGSQDAIGITYPGLNRLDYDRQYWPERITTVLDADVLRFLESHLYLRFVGPRPMEFKVLAQRHENAADAERLADAADAFWEAALSRDAAKAGAAMTSAYDAQRAMFPLMQSDAVAAELARHAETPGVLGHKVAGAGGGGYVVLFSDTEIPDAIRPVIRRED